MRKLQLPHTSYLHPMIHVFKNSSGTIVRQVLCYNPKGNLKAGRANHKYDAETCGWQRPLGFMYIGPVLCCRRCHRHIWGKESYVRCPQCGSKLGAQSTGSHTPVSYNGVPTGGTLLSSYTQEPGHVQQVPTEA
jgi:hypothetical protein